MRRDQNRLALRPETLRSLTVLELADVAGGAARPTAINWSCPAVAAADSAVVCTSR